MYVCRYCGSSNIVQDACVDPNTEKILDYYDNFYCNNCEETSKFVYTEEEFDEKQKAKN